MQLFSRTSRHPTPVAVTAVPAPVTRPVLDIPAIIQAHVLWKHRLTDYINGKGAPLDAKVVSADCKCTLGRWIHGEGQQHYGTHPALKEIQALHADFHRLAGQAVRAVDTGDRNAAHAIVTGPSFQGNSDQLKRKLAALYLSTGC